jgi:hypothetical protein
VGPTPARSLGFELRSPIVIVFVERREGIDLVDHVGLERGSGERLVVERLLARRSPPRVRSISIDIAPTRHDLSSVSPSTIGFGLGFDRASRQRSPDLGDARNAGG